MRGITVLAAIIALVALAGYIVRPSSKVASNALYIIAGIFAGLLTIGLVRLG
jgi:hypothetical protein